MSDGVRRILESDWIGPAVVALITGFAVCLTLDPTGDYPALPAGPGITLDEPFNASRGYYLAEAIGEYGIWVIDPQVQLEIYRDPVMLNDHPPLGRLWIGVSEKIAHTLCPPRGDAIYSLACARTAPAAAFMLLVFLIGWIAGKWYGRCAGIVAALSLPLMPRLFGHAHIASLESFINLTFAASVLVVAHYWNGEQPPLKRVACFSGVFFGLALLSKVQAIFLPLPIVAWALLRWRFRAIVPLLCWGLAGLAVFYAGWPHLWGAPVDHLLKYLGRTTERIELYNWYLGHRFADRVTPWHYPWVMFVVTVPLGLHLLAGIGLSVVRRQLAQPSRELLLLGTMIWPLLIFSLPGTPVYDGARLFLVVFSLWAIFAGRGAQSLANWLSGRMAMWKSHACLIGFLGLQSYGLVAMAPCWLSYYSLPIGGLRGADRLGMERSYWGDSVTSELLQTATEQIPVGSTLFVAPVLHNLQLPELLDQSMALQRREIQLKPYAQQALDENQFLLVFMRRAELNLEELSGIETIAEIRREGVLLAAVYKNTEKTVNSTAPKRY